jgi:hypothetical protein
MSRSDNRLEQLDELEALARWDQIRDRVPDPSLDTNATLSLDDDEPASRGRRFGLIAAALAIGLVGTVGLALAFRDRPTVSSEASPSAVLRITCDGNDVTVETPIVATQTDGLHIIGTATGTPSADILITSSGDPGATYASGSSGVVGEFVRTVPPGDARVGCTTENPETESTITGTPTAPFTIVDPEGFFVPYVPDCSDTLGVGPPRIVFTDLPPPATPEDAVRSDIDGLQPGDVVEQAGYVETSGRFRMVRITRDGAIIGSFHVDGSGGGFEVSGGLVCANSGLTPKNSGAVGTP